MQLLIPHPFKFISKSFALGLAFLLYLSPLQAQELNTSSPFQANLAPVASERNILADRAEWKEVAEERSINSSTFLTPDGRIIIQYSKAPLNFYNEQRELVPVNTLPTLTKNGLSATEQPFPVAVTNSGAVITNANALTQISFSNSCNINGTEAIHSSLIQKGAEAVMKDIIPGVDKTFEFRLNGVKYNYVLNHPATTGNQDLVIEEEILLPEGAKIQPDLNFGKKDKNGWMGVLSVTSASGEEIGRMQGALCFDSNGEYSIASYQLYDENGKQKIRIIVPAGWINAASRVYPITIDPLVTGPTTTYTGGFIPSCISPSSASDSILITIPGQITPTGFFVSGSYYASPFTTAIMSDGQMFFTTPCNTSTTFTVQPPAGNSAGTAYLTAFDLRNPLLCCFPRSCGPQTFYLNMHLSRTAPGTGCNSTYIYHDPTSAYPFSAYIEGRTSEPIASVNSQWSIAPGTVCSNECEITGTVRIRYGVPPFTITHPWATGNETVNGAAGCSLGQSSKELTLTIPNCPRICDTVSTLDVPPPVVTDSCGNIVSGLTTKTINIKATPDVVATPNSGTTCSGDPFSIALSSCLSTSTITWSGNNSSGTGDINDYIINTGTAPGITNYAVSAENDGCVSEPLNIAVTTIPLPDANFDSVPGPVISNTEITFADLSSFYGGNVINWNWDFGDNASSSVQHPIHSYETPGMYRVCLSVETVEGCRDSVCSDIEVIPAEIVLPNIITPNGDNSNDFLHIKHLQHFGDNTLKVFNRWGRVVFEKENYANDWNAAGFSDGTYFYVLTTSDGKNYTSSLQVLKK